jgi:uncharacterized protein (DUF1015 family)
MATIAPFRGVRYNPAMVADLTRVVTQPYDRIGTELQARYYELDPYNMTRLIKGQEYPDDTPTNNVYTRARRFYDDWMAGGQLIREGSPAFYVYHQTFTLPDGSNRTRKAFIAAFGLAEFEEGIVLPHERTLSGPKADRLNLFRATGVSLEQVFVLYPDPQNRINAVFEAALHGRSPDIDVREIHEKDVRQQMWVVQEEQVLAQVVAEMASKQGLIIADGHHRYETALNYRREMREKYADSPANTSFNYCTVTLVSMDDPGLVILPTHRVIFNYADKATPQVLEGASDYFAVTQLPSRGALESAMAQAASDERRIGFYDGGYYMLQLRSSDIMASVVPDRAPEWRSLDVSILHELIIERVMGISKSKVEAKENIDYYRDLDEAIDQVESGKALCVFMLNPTRMTEVKACSEKGEKMPQKSTDFYPKVITGLAAMPLDPVERL